MKAQEARALAKVKGGVSIQRVLSEIKERACFGQTELHCLISEDQAAQLKELGFTVKRVKFFPGYSISWRDL